MGGVATISQALLDGQKGGDAGNAQGENGDARPARPAAAARGSVDKYLDPHGGSATSGVAGGGGGGGGGYTTGEGGTKGVLGGGGGGGGNSYTTELSGRSHSLNTTRSANGYVKISWFYDERGTYTFQTTAVSSALMLEDNGGSTEAGHWVDIWQPIHDSNGLQTNYQWSYEYDADKNAGQLRNQDSGLCLEVNGTNGRIDQWPCDADSDNHLWKIVPVDGAGRRRPQNRPRQENRDLAPRHLLSRAPRLRNRYQRHRGPTQPGHYRLHGQVAVAEARLTDPRQRVQRRRARSYRAWLPAATNSQCRSTPRRRSDHGEDLAGEP